MFCNRPAIEKLGRIFLVSQLKSLNYLMVSSIDTILKELYSLQRLGIKEIEHTVNY